MLRAAAYLIILLILSFDGYGWESHWSEIMSLVTGGCLLQVTFDTGLTTSTISPQRFSLTAAYAILLIFSLLILSFDGFAAF